MKQNILVESATIGIIKRAELLKLSVEKYLLVCEEYFVENVTKKVEPPKEAKGVISMCGHLEGSFCDHCKPKEAKQCEHVFGEVLGEDGARCYKCETKEPTVVSKEEGTVTGTKTKTKFGRHYDIEYKPKEKKHQPNCPCFICKPPKTK